MNYTYYESGSTDPAFNLALEEYLFNTLPRGKPVLCYGRMTMRSSWANIKIHAAEINREYVKEHGIKVIRRLSGGGARSITTWEISITRLSATTAVLPSIFHLLQAGCSSP